MTILVQLKTFTDMSSLNQATAVYDYQSQHFWSQEDIPVISDPPRFKILVFLEEFLHSASFGPLD